jgi:alpha-L-rhamnosidase
MFAELAEQLGKTNDAAEYRRIRTGCAEAYHGTFYDPRTQRYGDDQVPNGLALRANIVPEHLRKTVAVSFARLVREKYNGHLWAGIYGAKYISEALFDAGEADLVLEMLEQKTYPGYGHQIEMGATTVWEQWHYQHGMETHNHAMFSGPAASFFSRLAGLTSIGNGFGYVRIKPAVPRALNEVACTYESVRGTFMVHWKKEGGMFTLEITIPPNCRARVELPDGLIKETGGGAFVFTVHYGGLPRSVSS